MVGMDTCTRCKTALPEDSRFCPRCGAATRPAEEGDHLLASSASDPTGLLDRLRAATEGELEVLRELGRGGMGRVFLAQEIALDRRVALKVLPPAYLDHPEIVVRFQREARTAGRLRHPNIVPVYQVTERQGIHFFTMPYVAGPSLRQVLRQTPRLEVPLCARYVREAAAALHHAHAQGVIHRDIKPENMLLEGSRDGRLLLTDFGIAKALDSATSLTRPGDVVGTPYYMSPELCRQSQDIDGRSDQYSLALVAYEMLAGRFPFSADSMAALVYKHLHEEPAPLGELRPDVPEPFLQAIEIATRKDPEARFPTAAAFAEAISSGRFNAPSPPPRSAHSARRHRRIRWSAGIAALATALIAVAGLIYTRSDMGAPPDGEDAPPGAASSDIGPDPLRDDPSLVEAGTGLGEEGLAAGPSLGGGPDTASLRAATASREVSDADPEPNLSTDPVAVHRREVERAGEQARQAQKAAREVGADSIYPDEYGRLTQVIGAAELDLASGSLVAAALGFARVSRDFEQLTEAARQAQIAGPSGEEGSDPPATGDSGQVDSVPITPEPVGGDAGTGAREDRAATVRDSAVAHLIEIYRRAFEAEDLERLRLELYDGRLPAEDEAFIRQWFDAAEGFEVALELRSLDAGEEGSAVALLRQTMSYRLTGTLQSRNWSGLLRMAFRRGTGGWRLERLDLAR